MSKNQKIQHTKPVSYFRDQANCPEWVSEEAIITMMRGYLNKDETPYQMYRRLSKTAASYYPEFMNEKLTRNNLEQDFYHAFINGWLSPATPVAANLGSGTKHLPVSCNSIYVPNSIEGIFDSIKEAALLSKHGAGLGINLSDVVGLSNVVDWSKFFDLVSSVVSQG